MATEGAVRTGGPRTLEVRAGADSEDEAGSAGFAAGADRFYAHICGKWCRVFVHREQSPGPQLVQRFMITIEVLMCTRADLERMMREAKRRAGAVENRQIVELCDKWGGKSRVTMPKRSPGTLCLPAGLYDSIESRVREFCDSRDAYERAGIPWRLGVLLAGQPGTGKTSIAHVLASQLDLRLAVMPLADLRSDEDMISAFMGVEEQAILLIEDVDCAFRQRKSEEADGVSFSAFLNCIDGVLAPHSGRVLVMSTNHPERLDPALIRPGRVDLRVDVPALTRQAASDYVDRVFPHVASRHDVVDEVMAGDRPTPAALINRLMREDWRRPSRADRSNEVAAAGV
jgi:chaperone BCS1